MGLELGDDAFGNTETVTYEAGESVSAGDAVAINGGQLATADGTTDTNPIGIVASSVDSSVSAGDEVPVHVRGTVVANVAGGVSAGTELGVSATEGQLGAASGGFEALSDEGAASGLGVGSVPTGGAVTKLP